MRGWTNSRVDRFQQETAHLPLKVLKELRKLGKVDRDGLGLVM